MFKLNNSVYANYTSGASKGSKKRRFNYVYSSAPSPGIPSLPTPTNPLKKHYSISRNGELGPPGEDVKFFWDYGNSKTESMTAKHKMFIVPATSIIPPIRTVGDAEFNDRRGEYSFVKSVGLNFTVESTVPFRLRVILYRLPEGHSETCHESTSGDLQMYTLQRSEPTVKHNGELAYGGPFQVVKSGLYGGTHILDCASQNMIDAPLNDSNVLFEQFYGDDTGYVPGAGVQGFKKSKAFQFTAPVGEAFRFRSPSNRDPIGAHHLTWLVVFDCEQFGGPQVVEETRTARPGKKVVPSNTDTDCDMAVDGGEDLRKLSLSEDSQIPQVKYAQPVAVFRGGIMSKCTTQDWD